MASCKTLGVASIGHIATSCTSHGGATTTHAAGCKTARPNSVCVCLGFPSEWVIFLDSFGSPFQPRGPPRRYPSKNPPARSNLPPHRATRRKLCERPAVKARHALPQEAIEALAADFEHLSHECRHYNHYKPSIGGGKCPRLQGEIVLCWND